MQINESVNRKQFQNMGFKNKIKMRFHILCIDIDIISGEKYRLAWKYILFPPPHRHRHTIRYNEVNL